MEAETICFLVSFLGTCSKLASLLVSLCSPYPILYRRCWFIPLFICLSDAVNLLCMALFVFGNLTDTVQYAIGALMFMVAWGFTIIMATGLALGQSGVPCKLARWFTPYEFRIVEEIEHE